MYADLILENARISRGQQILEANIAVDDGKIVRIAKKDNTPSASQRIDLGGLLVLPGVIDVHTHLRDEELSYKEDFYSGTAAAANGGVTLAIDMPNNKPVTQSVETLRKRMKIASERTIINIAFHSAFPERIGETKQLVEEGAKSFKFFMSQKIGGLDPRDEESTLTAFKKVAEIDSSISVHAEDIKILEKKEAEMKASHRNNIDAYMYAHSVMAEHQAIEQILEKSYRARARLHICHVSTKKGLNMITKTKKRGQPVTCEVTPHHLLLTSSDARKLGALGLTNPPLRTSDDVSSLWDAIRRDQIDIIASDHAPHSVDEKNAKSIWETAPGISGLETLLPLMLTEVNRGHVSLSKLVSLLSERPASLFNIQQRGYLREGFCADLIVVDMKKEWTIDSSKFFSKAKYSPFDGWRVRGKPVKTFVGGRIVMEEGEITAKPGDGSVVK